jgi:hypothetical protein
MAAPGELVSGPSAEDQDETDENGDKADRPQNRDPSHKADDQQYESEDYHRYLSLFVDASTDQLEPLGGSFWPTSRSPEETTSSSQYPIYREVMLSAANLFEQGAGIPTAASLNKDYFPYRLCRDARAP